MPRTVTIQLAENAKGCARPRYNRAQQRFYLPEKTRALQQLIIMEWNKNRREEFTGPIIVRIHAVIEMAQSWPKKKKESAIGKPHTQKPDIDNIEKTILDALQGHAYKDDCQVYQIHTIKTWGILPCLTITLQEG